MFLRVSTEKTVVVFMEKISVLLSLIESGPDVKVVVEITLIKGFSATIDCTLKS